MPEREDLVSTENHDIQGGALQQGTPPTAPDAPNTTPAPFMPEVPRAEALDLAAVIRRSKDRGAQEKKKDALGLDAEVLVPGLPNGKVNEEGEPEYGLMCKVRRLTGFQQGQIVFKQREGAQIDDKRLFTVPEELSSPDARAGWWRDIWRLVYGCSDETKRVLAAIATGNPSVSPAAFGVKEAIYWMTCPESDLVADPLLQGIVILNYYSKDKVKTSAELDDFKAFPEVLDALVAAYKGGFLADYLQGNPDVIQMVMDNVGLLTALQTMVSEQDAAMVAKFNKDAFKQAIRECIIEYWESNENGIPTRPTPDMKLFSPELAQPGDPNYIAPEPPPEVNLAGDVMMSGG